jgi:hypothetical protein
MKQLDINFYVPFETHRGLNCFLLSVIIRTSALVSAVPPVHPLSSHVNWTKFRTNLLEKLLNLRSPFPEGKLNLEI